MRFNFILFCLSLVFMACQNSTEQASSETVEETTNNTVADTTETETSTTVEPISESQGNPNFVATKLTPDVMFVKDDHIILTDQSKVELPKPGDDKTVIFLTRHGQRKEGKTSLSPLGGVQATRLANILRDAELKTVYWNDNSSMQTGFHTATANEAELLNFNVQDLASFVGIIKKNDLGSRIMVVSDIITVPEVMNRFLNGGPFKTLGLDDYDDLYIMLLEGEEVADIYHTKMYKLQ